MSESNHDNAAVASLMERILYLIPDRSEGRPARWGFRSVENLGAELTHFDQQALLRMLKAVFAA